MIKEDEALAHVIESVKPLPSRRVPLAQAGGCFAAQDVFARVPLPVFDNSAMDGYAVVAGACRDGQGQRVVGEQPAGVDRKFQIHPGQAVRIFTGAPIPAGADAVVMQEDVRCADGEILVEGTIEPGEFIRRRGCDVTEGQRILAAGAPLRPPALALLAAQGLAEIDVGGKVQASIITTGDELVQPGGSLEAGQIFESNSILTQSLFEKCGVAVGSVSHCPDDAASLEMMLRKSFDNDVLVILGGVSVGARDFVRPALTASGAQTDLWQVSVKPGKPFLFGRAGRCAVFALPGNPVSAFMTFQLFVRPAVLRMMGAIELSLPIYEARLTEAVENGSDRPHYVRGRVINGKFTPIGRQESHALYGLSLANALLRVPPGGSFSREAMVPIQVFG